MRAILSLPIILLFTQISYASWDDIIATPMEEVTTVGHTVKVEIKFERDLGFGMLDPDVSDMEVEFRYGENQKKTKTVITNENGIAAIEFTPISTGKFIFIAEIIDEESETIPIEIPVYVFDKNDLVIVTDVDGTLSDLPDYLIPFYGSDAPTYPNAPETIRWLSSQAKIIYLTNRDDTLYESTHEFLNYHKFPDGPVLFNRWTSIDDLPYFRDPLQPGIFKEWVLKQLIKRELSIIIGLGNANSDAYAYTKAGIKSYIFDNGEEEEITYPSIIYKSYRELKRRIESVLSKGE